ncbi:hypothetical protein [Micromonospora sp. NPDC007230]|uniref:hypothetical protein n=1 Tax=Micromonospora sp. NPDC007230 TaxID=3364237 RepID=UPI0036AFC34D
MLGDRLVACARPLLGLDEHGVAELARQAVRQLFLDEPGKSAVLAEFDAYVAHRASAAS